MLEISTAENVNLNLTLKNIFIVGPINYFVTYRTIRGIIMTTVKMPTKAAVTKLGKNALIAGAVGGVGVAVGSAIVGPTLGAPLGAIIAGAAVGGNHGEIVAINGVMDGMVMLMTGGMGGNSNAGVM